MPRFMTTRNRVVADDPEPDDVFVQVAWRVPSDDERYQRYVELPLRPIAEYADIVRWACDLADKLAHPIYVLPLSHSDILETNRFEPYRKLLENLDEAERCDFRQMLVDSCASLMLESDDHATRTKAHHQLQSLGVVSSAVRAES